MDDDTVRKFWKMIIETQCPTIVMLCDLIENDRVGLFNKCYIPCAIVGSKTSL